ncbi:hypothetical protein ACFL1T_03915 [Chlamydiota bacterium]
MYRYKNKRIKRKNAAKSRFILKTFTITVFFAFIGICYVWQQVQAVRIGYTIKNKENITKELHKKMQSLEVVLSRLKMPHCIKNNLAEKNINLCVPDSWQIVKVSKENLLFTDLYSIDSHKKIHDSSKQGKTIISISCN